MPIIYRNILNFNCPNCAFDIINSIIITIDFFINYNSIIDEVIIG